MKGYPSFIVLLCILGAGCANHRYQIDGDDLTLVLMAPGAERVELLCSLEAFMPRAATKVAGRWEVTLPSHRAFKYFYRIDGAAFVPDCPLKEHDDFGAATCIFDPRW